MNCIETVLNCTVIYKLVLCDSYLYEVIDYIDGPLLSTKCFTI